MKKYLIRLFKITVLFILVLIVLICSRAYIIRSHSWRLNDGVNIVFLGASHINRAIDDSMMEHAVNWSRPSERYMFTYIKLDNLIHYNPQIDTVFLELAPTDLLEDTDYKYHELNEQTGYVKLYCPFFSWENWGIYCSEPFQVISLVLGSLVETEDLSQSGWYNHMGGYNGLQAVMDTTTVSPQLEKSRGYGNNINYDYLRRIIRLCEENNVKLFFIETPTWHPEYFYDQVYYYDAIKTNFSDIEFCDYSKWPTSIDEFYDAHHLNKKGSIRFTQEIKNRYNIK